MTTITSATDATPESVDIRPGVSVLSLFRHLNYHPWYALAEFVDNALQSYLSNRAVLESVEGSGFKLVVRVEYEATDVGQMIVRDNAAGISSVDYRRAFKTAQPPPDRNGLSQFGVGMKSAASWFAERWSVRTSALGEEVERQITLDVDDIVRNQTDHVAPRVTQVHAKDHFTEVVLKGLHSPIHQNTQRKIKEHLASIYRAFIRDGLLELHFNRGLLVYKEPKVLHAAHFKEPDAEKKVWRKEIEFDFGLGQRVRGFAALRATASTKEAGFALFSRGRLIQGSADQGYRPEEIFKRSNSYTYQRLFGELHVEGIDVSHTKDGFQWGEDEETFLQFLKDELNGSPLPLIDQAEGFRVRPTVAELRAGAETVLNSTARVVEQEVPPVLGPQLATSPDNPPPPPDLAPSATLTTRVIDVELNDQRWRIVLELTSDPAIGDWLSIADQASFVDLPGGTKLRRVAARLSLTHPFMTRFAGNDPERIEPLLRVAAGLMLAEAAARETGNLAGLVRFNLNEMLRDALSKP